MMHELYRDCDSECKIANNNMNLHEKYDIPELPVMLPVIMSLYHLTPSQPPAVSSYQPMQLQPPISAASVPTFEPPLHYYIKDSLKSTADTKPCSWPLHSCRSRQWRLR